MQPSKSLSEFLQHDHERLDALLERFSNDLSDREAYLEFRSGLLKHIRFEETLLFKAAQRANNGIAIELAAKLRLDHGAIAALLVPSPTPKIIQALQTVLRTHNALEEVPDGAYAECDALLEADAGRIIEEFESMKPVPMAKNTDIPLAMAAAGRALERAGFSRSLISSEGSAQ
ncbi:MAG TPA: hemerythrin domain-containing protein [Candidatus Kapabacteria bacterium]|nr:hemerythrin domain-containing protein [Candidatus Kapabacteria bacterium]